MQGLHNIRIPPPNMAWRWYAAYQTRRGRRHLIHVPLIEADITPFIDGTARRMPYGLRYLGREARESWGRGYIHSRRNLMFPNNVNVDSVDIDDEPTHSARRYCNGQQEARYYMYDRTSESPAIANDTRPRGFCETCWNAWSAPSSVQRANVMDTLHANPIGYLNVNQARWEETSQRDFRPS